VKIKRRENAADDGGKGMFLLINSIEQKPLNWILANVTEEVGLQSNHNDMSMD
jgi:hypothetical protein